jgi:hypothetical protein
MLSDAVLLVVNVVAIQAETGIADFSTHHIYYASRLVGALLTATVVPLLIDRSARRSSRVLR